MKYPTLTELYTTREMIDVFGGYNHNLRIGAGEFYDMTNLTSADYPVLSPRPKRGIHAEPDNPQGFIYKDALWDVDGKTLYKNNIPIKDSKMELYTNCNGCPLQATCDNYKAGSTVCKKTMISMGAYIIILPDKKYINTVDDNDCGNIEATKTTDSTVTFTLCQSDGSVYQNTNDEGEPVNVPYGDTAPGNPKNLDFWIDTSSTPHVLKQYAKTTEQWTSVATTYIKIHATGIGVPFSEGDGVRIQDIDVDEVLDLNNTMIIKAKGDDYIVVLGMLDKVCTTDKPITISRQMPYMDFVIEANNRLWGCRYGVDVHGDIVNRIYASKLGDFKNWHCYEGGISTSSYYSDLGTDGQFTGAINYLGYPLFFKENCVHKVYGYYPSNYQIQATACRGVQKGSHKSLAILNETLYYKAQSAVCAYDGSLPVEMSSALGDVAYRNAVAGVLGNKYYISMQDGEGDYHLFVYDAAKGMWHREDNTQAVEFCSNVGNLYYLDYASKQIKSVIGTTSQLEESAVEWSAVTGVIGTGSPDKKYVSRLVVRLSLEVGATVTFSAEYDSSGEWEHLFTKSGTKLGSFSVPLRTRRCDHFRLRITGKGEAKIYSIAKTIEQGSDI